VSEKILVVDDDAALVKTLDTILTAAGFTSLLAHTAEDGLRLALSHQPALALLDVMVPGMGGWELCRRLREFSSLPIIFLTALSNVENVVHGLEMGADDYVVKPIDPAELIARVKAHLRRVQTAVSSPPQLSLNNGELTIDLSSHHVSVQGREIDLTPREFELLAALVSNLDHVVPTTELVKQAWGMTDDSAIDNIKPYIYYLRQKIETDPAAPKWIQTIRGVGYRFTSG
jgi:DNA-binding response OmpR family regulator